MMELKRYRLVLVILVMLSYCAYMFAPSLTVEKLNAETYTRIPVPMCHVGNCSIKGLIRNMNATRSWPRIQDEKTGLEDSSVNKKQIINPFDTGIPMPYTLKDKIRALGLNITVDADQCAKWHFSKPPLMRTALASFPGSGNTWTRYLIQKLTGIFTGGIYKSLFVSNTAHSFVKYPLLDKLNWNGSVVAIKTHKSGWFINHKRLGRILYDQAIVIIRNPYHALVAEFHRQNCKRDKFPNSGHTGLAAKRLFYTSKWKKYVVKTARGWHHFYTQWLNQTKWPEKGKSLYLLQYEDLVHNLEGEIIKLGQFLGVDERILSNSTRMKCVTSRSSNQLKRKKVVFHKSPFTEKMNKTLDKYIREVKTLVKIYFNKTLSF